MTARSEEAPRIDRLFVVGAGAMGSQIAMAAARAGLGVTLTDIDAGVLDTARARLQESSSALVAKGKVDPADDESAWSRLDFTTDGDVAVADADLVLEAVVEKLDVKRELFARLATRCRPDAVLASNSSSLIPSRIAEGLPHPDRFCNIHFFNPVHAMRGVEVVRGPQTSDATIDAAVAFVERLGKEPIVLEKEIHGFVANRILDAVRGEAIRLVEGGYATPATVDRAARTALNYPMGPFELMDLTGIDIGYHSKKARFEETGDPADAPSRSVTELVEAGHLGRKTGRGWYLYGPDGTRTEPTDRKGA